MGLMTDRRRSVLFLTLFGALGLAVWFRLTMSEKGNRAPTTAEFMTNALQTLNTFEEQEAKKNWEPELLAGKYGQVIEQFWDKLNASTNKLGLVATLDLKAVQCANYSRQTNFPHGIQLFTQIGRAHV